MTDDNSTNLWIQRVAAALCIGIVSWIAERIRESKAFSQNEFLPHGMCYLWHGPIVWSHVAADGLIALSYTVITCFLLFSEARKVVSAGMTVWFAIFIGGCGLIHVMDVLNIWTHYYWIDEAIRSLTAIASVATAINIAVLSRRLNLERLIRELSGPKT